MVYIYATQRNERFLLDHSFLLHEKCCFVLVLSFRKRLNPRLDTYVITIDYRGRWSVDGWKRAIRCYNLRRIYSGTPIQRSSI